MKFISPAVLARLGKFYLYHSNDKTGHIIPCVTYGISVSYQFRPSG